MKRKKSIQRMLVGLSVVPAIFIGVTLMIISAHSLWTGRTGEISNSLAIAANSLYNTYSLVAPGDYRLEDGVLMKGDRVLEGDYTIVDALKESYGMEISLFYGDERRLTTITDENGNRLTGTKADAQTVEWVLKMGRQYFSRKLEINGEDYFGYYVPILNKDKSVVGMAFAGKKRVQVMEAIGSNIMNSLLVCMLVVVATLLVCVASSQKIIKSLQSITEYLGFLAQSDFSHRMPKHVTDREDEIGDMGKYAVDVSHSLCEMITTDPLTKLLNRRACIKYLNGWIDRCNKQGADRITVAIADIDYFKKINDTYGHDCGDKVLVTVSEIMQKHVTDRGCVARWGGEEFLIVFEEEAEAAREALYAMLDEIKKYRFDYEGETFSITLTAGVNGSIIGHSFNEIVKNADECLYKGKTDGRNRVVFTDGLEVAL